MVLILEQIRDSRGESDSRVELLRELELVKNQLDFAFNFREKTPEYKNREEEILSPAEKIFGRKLYDTKRLDAREKQMNIGLELNM